MSSFLNIDQKRDVVIKYFLDVYKSKIDPKHPDLTNSEIEKYYKMIHKLSSDERNHREKTHPNGNLRLIKS